MYVQQQIKIQDSSQNIETATIKSYDKYDTVFNIKNEWDRRIYNTAENIQITDTAVKRHYIYLNELTVKKVGIVVRCWDRYRYINIQQRDKDIIRNNFHAFTSYWIMFDELFGCVYCLMRYDNMIDMNQLNENKQYELFSITEHIVSLIESIEENEKIISKALESLDKKLSAVLKPYYNVALVSILRNLETITATTLFSARYPSIPELIRQLAYRRNALDNYNPTRRV